jgi:hypothetical protein
LKKYFSVFVIFTLFIGCGRVGDGSFSSSNRVSTSGSKSSGGLSFQTVKKSIYIPSVTGQFSNSGHYRTVIRTSGKPEIYAENDLLKVDSNYKLIENGKIKDESKVVIERSNNEVKSKIMLLLDLSGSILEDEALSNQLIQESSTFINNILNNGSFEIAIYYFNSKKDIMPLSQNTESPISDAGMLTMALNNIKDPNFIDTYLKGFISTNLYGAVKQSSQRVCTWINCQDEGSFEMGSVIVFTDGKDLADIVTKADMLNSLEKNVQYYTIGIGKYADNRTLVDISGSEHHFEASSDKIESAFTDTFNDISRNSNFYQVNYCPATQRGNVAIKVLFEDSEHKIKAQTVEDMIKLNDGIDLRCDL